jgi:hypothetical protein
LDAISAKFKGRQNFRERATRRRDAGLHPIGLNPPRKTKDLKRKIRPAVKPTKKDALWNPTRTFKSWSEPDVGAA